MSIDFSIYFAEVYLMEKAEFLFKVINRFDTYYTSINTKASVLLAFQVFIFASICSKYSEILPDYNKAKYLFIFITIILLLIALVSLGSVFSIIYTIKPYLKSPNDKFEYSSNIFFGHIAYIQSSDFYENKVLKLSDGELVRDLSSQCYALAKGLNGKFKCFRTNCKWVLFLQLPLFLFLIILKFISTF